MKIATIVMAVIVVALIGVAIWRGEGSLQKGLTFGGKTFLSTLPLLILAFAIAGLVQVLVPREFIIKWLGAGSGWRACTTRPTSRAKSFSATRRPTTGWRGSCGSPFLRPRRLSRS